MSNHAKPGKEEKNNQKFVSKPRINEPNTSSGHSDKIREWSAKPNNEEGNRKDS